jgi:hypothetical protein
MSAETTATESVMEKAGRLRRERAEREAAYAASDAAFELRELELDAKYSAEIGRRGVDWAMVSEAKANVLVIVKLGSDLAFRAYIDAVTTTEGGVDAADLFAFVAPCVVHPGQQEYAEIVRARGFIANRCADAVSSLHLVRQKKVEGKF